jgi:hypothetical protein
MNFSIFFVSMQHHALYLNTYVRLVVAGHEIIVVRHLIFL